MTNMWANLAKRALPLPLRHRLERLRARLRGEPATVIHGQAYQVEFPGVPIDSLRGERILTALVREGLLGREAVLAPARATLATLERVHSLAYLEQVTDPERMLAVFGVEVPTPLIHRVVELQRTMVGGTVQAAAAARRQHKLAINLGGGLHHAHRDRGQGFCLFNDIAVAIAELRRRGFSDPIAVIDLDLHDGDGTRAIFADDPSVFTLSIHNAHWGPIEAESSLAIALGDQVGDREYLASIREHVPAMLDRHRPGLIFYLAGCDPAADDTLGNWQVTDEGMLARDVFVLESLDSRGIDKRVWLLGGGYGSESWRYSARGLIAALGGPEHAELPSTQSITLMRYQHLAHVLDPRELSGVAPGELQFDESDLFGGVTPLGPAPKVLGFYTHHGVELALERYGLLPRLRALGFEPRIEFDHDGEAGDTLRIFGDASRELLLIELRVRRDHEILPGAELLRIEWLLLQNPRASWTAGRLPLAGQRHPGLRMFADIAALMSMVCARLRLDGIVVVPSHYHVAARWHPSGMPEGRHFTGHPSGMPEGRHFTGHPSGMPEGRMRFLDPASEGHFRALGECLAGLPLAEASAALELGRVIDRRSGERASHRPAAMILPASDALRRRFDEAWEREAEAVRASLQFELVAR